MIPLTVIDLEVSQSELLVGPIQVLVTGLCPVDGSELDAEPVVFCLA